MNWAAPGTLLRVLVPLLAGVALGAVLEIAIPHVRVYMAISPGLLAGLAGLLSAVVAVAVIVIRRRIAVATAAAAALRRATAEAVQDRQDRLRFLMRLDHELKNPLTAIRAGLANAEHASATGAATSAVDDGAMPAADGAAAALATVSAQADRITRLVSDLRKLAELETQEIEAAPVNMPALLHEVAEAVGEIPGASERTIRVTVPQAPWPLPLVEGDRDLLFVALQNLVANAVKFTAPGDTVEIRASEDDEGLVAEVADTGAGIPPDEIGEVWQELARGRAARSLPGTGLGLALVRVIVTRHGGRVAIRSREGQGTVVSVWLPLPGRGSIAPDVPVLRQRRDSDGKAAV
jgi:two-component system, OmpR family, sensor kinase